MKRVGFLAVVILSIALYGWADEPESETDSTDFYYTSNGEVPVFAAQKGDQTVFLIPTLHYGVSLSEVPPVVSLALQQSELFIAEFDLTDEEAGKQSEKALKPLSAKWRDLLTWRGLLKGQLSDLEWARLKEATAVPLFRRNPEGGFVWDFDERSAFSDFALSRMTPLYVMSMMANLARQQMTAFGELDKGLIETAKALGKETFFLDDPSAIYEWYMRQTDSGNSLQDLKECLQKGDEPILNELITTRQLYLAGDVIGLYQIAASEPSIEACGIEDNGKWMSKIQSKIAGYKKVAIAVGAFHLVGNTGFISQFLQRGYSVTHLDSSETTSKFFRSATQVQTSCEEGLFATGSDENK